MPFWPPRCHRDAANLDAGEARNTDRFTMMKLKQTMLPGLLGEVEEVAGREAAIALATAKGGQRVTMCSQRTLLLKPDHWLNLVVGPEAALKIASLFPIGGDIEIPMGRQFLRRLKLNHIHELSESGKSANEIAMLLGTSRRQIVRSLKRLRESGQL